MTPNRLRLFVVAFIAVTAAITTNALYLQEAPRLAGAAIRSPAPAAEDNLTTAATATAALPKSDPAPIIAQPEPAPLPKAEAEPPRPAAPKPVPAKLVKAIQRELLARGYGTIQVNGVLGVETRAAIIAYEFDELMPLSGEASEALLKSLIFGEAGKGSPGPASRFERRQSLIAEVQQALSALHYRTGPADGKLDAETREAIRKFESDRRLQAAGRLTERVLLEMVIVRGRPLG